MPAFSVIAHVFIWKLGDGQVCYMLGEEYMEYLVFWGAMGLFILFVIGQGIYTDRKNKRYYLRKLQESYGKRRDKEYKAERCLRIPGYYENHREPGQIDDITWNDLSMDQVFRRLNYTLSSSGEEVLYYLLRTPNRTQEQLQYFDQAVTYFMEEKEQRIAFQRLMGELGSTGKYSLYDYLQYLHTLGNRSNVKDTVVNLLFLPAILLLFFHLPAGLAVIAILMVYQIVTYLGMKREIEPYITSLAYITRLLTTVDKTLQLQLSIGEQEYELLRQGRKALSRSRKGAYWIFSKTGTTTGGSPLDILLDYVRMAFHVDLIYFNKMLKEIVKHEKEIDQIITSLGYLESAVSVAMYRASLEREGRTWCKPDLQGSALHAEELYHPLIESPVKNSITTRRGVLLTGSNASGKSTFLKTVALSALMAQTLYTVLADAYRAPCYRIYSSMSLKDDLESGESYYIVEIKSIKRILDAMKEESDRPVLCFVDEVLRGTNTVERIAAGTQILLSLTGDRIQCFAATHDIELTELLSDQYDNYHFEEEIRNGDILFSYTLQKGRASSRNAIRLLEIMGYEPDIIKKAQKQAENFLQQGIWKLS